MGFLHTDIPELRGYDTGLVLSNLGYMQQDRIFSDEAMLAQLWELATAIQKDACGDADTRDSILRSLLALAEDAFMDSPPLKEDTMPGDMSGDISPLQHALPINRDLLRQLHRRTGLMTRLLLYQFLTEQEAASSSPVTPPRPPKMAPSVRGRIAYMRSAFADSAYLRFSQALPEIGIRAVEAHSFVDACEEVFNGLCEYCILPLESAEQGHLVAFSRLIIKYHLYIVAACDMENTALSADGRHATRFGLLRRQTDADADPRLAPALCPALHTSLPTHRLALLHATPGGVPSLSDLLCATDFCGLSLCRTDTLPMADALTGGLMDSDEYSVPPAPSAPPVCVDLDITETSPSALANFLTWMALEAPDDTLLGMYGTV